MKRPALTIRELDALTSLTSHGNFRAKVHAIVDEMNASLEHQPAHIRVVYGARTFGEQWRIYAKGRTETKDGWVITVPSKIVTYAKPTESAHCYAAAADIALEHDKDNPTTPDRDETNTWLHADHPLWDRLAAFVRAAGLVTGSDFKRLRDRAHMELPGWARLARSGALAPVGG